MRRLAIVLCVLCLLAGIGWLGRDWLKAQLYLVVLEWDERLEKLQIEQVISTLAPTPGDLIADIGAGTGVFARPLARAVAPDGSVYAVDVNSHLLRHIERTAAAAGQQNIRTIFGDFDDPLLPEPVDLIFLCNTLHHIQGRQAYLETLRRYLRPGGKIAVIDFRQGSSPHRDPALQFSADELDLWMTGAGYELDSRFNFIEDNFFLVYRLLD